jgi:ABC-2 type transport system permease protein
MNTSPADAPVLVARDLLKTFRRETGETIRALDGVSLQVQPGTITALVGPDGAGKTTLLRLASGLMTADSGTLEVLGIDVAANPQAVQDQLGYMPQRFGLYEDLSVEENLNLYADLTGVTQAQRRERYPRLMEMTALSPFVGRLAGKLSGGMKQKLGLACTLVRSPPLLLLDEPTVGVDPLSRRELWAIIQQLAREQNITVLLSTAYLDEAQRCDEAIVLHAGRVLAQCPPQEVSNRAAGRTFLVDPGRHYAARGLQARLLTEPGVVDAVPEGGQVRLVLDQGTEIASVLEHLPQDTPAVSTQPKFEDGFMVLLHETDAHAGMAKLMAIEHPPQPEGSAPVVEVNDLVRKFGDFTAVDHLSFDVRQGEVFGLLGPNGAGKTTTFRMLCGLLPATSGRLRVAGVDLRVARASARQRIGYVAQKFSLYAQLSVIENLEFFCGAYGLRGRQRRDRVRWALEQFELEPFANLPSGQLPGGYKQRLAMAVALVHEPAILFLDEPTSGVDPLTRREFWQRITALAEQGVTVIVTTHFMEEAEYCDRVAILDAGRILAQGTPAELRSHSHPGPDLEPTMEDAFISIVEESRTGDGHLGETSQLSGAGASKLDYGPALDWLPAKSRRVWALVQKESRQMMRDASSIAIGIVLPVILILLFGYGLSLDVTNVPMAVVLEEPSPDAFDLAAAYQLSPTFDARLITSMPEAQRLMLARKIDAIVRIQSDFERDMKQGNADVQILVHGTDANRGRIIQAYAQGAVGNWSLRRAAEGRGAPAGPVIIQDRLWFNDANESRYFLVPGLIVLIMTLIGSFLTTLVMAREWERGTLEALFVTPVRVGEILLGKTIPNFVLGMIGLVLCVVTAKFLFHVPLRGSLWLLTVSSMLYLVVALAIGLLISAAVKSQFVASQITILITFLPALMLSGFLFDLRSMPTFVRAITYVLPARYFVTVLQTVFLAGDVWNVIVPSMLVLVLMAVVLLTIVRVATQKTLA